MSYGSDLYSPAINSKVSEWEQFFYDAYRTWSVYYAEAYRDLRSYAGDNWSNKDRTSLQLQNRTVLELNKIRRVINMFSGFEREHRTSTIVTPFEDGAEQTAEQMSDAMIQVYEKGGANFVWSEGFEHMLKTGLAVVGIYMDYNYDKINGDIKFFWKPFNAVMFDPYFTRRDMSDCDQVATRDLLSKEHVKGLLPWVSPAEIDAIPTGIRDNRFQYLGIYRQYNSTYIAKHLVTYDQYWKVIQRPCKMIVNLDTGEQQEWKGDDAATNVLRAQLEDLPGISLIDTHKRSVELNIIVGGQLVYSGKDPTGLDDYPFRPLICYHEPLIDTYELKIQGVVRQIRDAQVLYNKRHSQINDIVESVLNTGWIVRNGAVVDPTMLFQTGQGRTVVLNTGFDVNNDIKQIVPQSIPPSLLQYQDVIDRDILEIPGGNQEFLGIANQGNTQISGDLAEQRASQGLIGTRSVFDNADYTKRQLGGIVLKAIQLNYSPAKIERMIKREVTPDFFMADLNRYDVAIKETVSTQTQRDANYHELLRLRSLGVQSITDDMLVESAPVSLPTKLKERMMQQQQADNEEKQRISEDLAVERALRVAQTDTAIALAQERRARVLADIGLARERISEAEQNKAKSVLDMVKSVAEIQDLDRRGIMDVIKFVEEVQDLEQARQEETLATDVERSEVLKGDNSNGE